MDHRERKKQKDDASSIEIELSHQHNREESVSFLCKCVMQDMGNPK